MKTKADVIELAFRRLGIKAEGEAVSADQSAYAGRVIDALFDELGTSIAVSWYPDQIEDAAAVPLANLLAVEIGPSYNIAVEPRGRALARLLAAMRPDTRVKRPTEPQYF